MSAKTCSILVMVTVVCLALATACTKNNVPPEEVPIIAQTVVTETEPIQETVVNNETQLNTAHEEEAWRMDAAEVANRYAVEVLALEGETELNNKPDKEFTRAMFTKQNGGQITIDLYQPAEKGADGIWEVEGWYDENSRYYPVRDLSVLPLLFAYDDNVPENIREAVRDAIVPEWTEAFGAYYEVLGFESRNVVYEQADNQAEVKFVLTMFTRNFYQDPDTVGYIKEAKDNGSEHYQQMYDEYNAPQTNNFNLMATLTLTDAGTVEPGTVQLLSNVSPNGEEYVPVTAADYILN